MNRTKGIIIFTAAIDIIGLGVIIPVLPLYVGSFGVSVSTITALLSVFSLFSFISAPFLGALSDKIGRRPVLIFSILSTSIGWFVFAGAKSLSLLFLGRVIDGLAAGNLSTIQSAMVDISKDNKERVSNLGIIGMIFGLGFIVGPFIGGLLGSISHTLPFWFVGGLSLLNTILAYFFLPETNLHLDKNKKLNFNPLSPIVKALKKKDLINLNIVWFISNLVAFGFNSIFALYLAKIYGLSSFGTGLTFTGVGIIISLNQGFLLKNFWLKKLTERRLILLMFAFFIVGFALMSFTLIGLFVSSLVLTTFAQSNLRTAITSEIVGESDSSERGETIGVLTAIASVATIIAPLYFGFAFELNTLVPFASFIVLSVIAFVLMYKEKNSNHKNKNIMDQAREVVST